MFINFTAVMPEHITLFIHGVNSYCVPVLINFYDSKQEKQLVDKNRTEWNSSTQNGTEWKGTEQNEK